MTVVLSDASARSWPLGFNTEPLVDGQMYKVVARRVSGSGSSYFELGTEGSILRDPPAN